MRLFAEADLVFDKDIIPTIELLHEFKNNETDKMVNDIRNSSKIIIWVVSIPFIFVIIASALLSFFLSRNMSRAIISLTEAADAISLGDFSKAVTATTKDEIGDLAQAVERMRVSLQKALERLKKRK
ncbi:HAMP domain-containing protein [candidate division KSB1 bacterium]|nr:HAMP domain-containing protein [candidate division KSB1 bacterium]